MSFRDNRLSKLTLPPATVWLLADIAEAKGREELYTRQSPHILKALREMAVIQSAESSNRIEGVTVEPDRLKPLVLGNARPRDRSEEEVVGYRQALNLIHERAGGLQVEPDVMLHLHSLCTRGGGDAGQFKQRDNDIVEVRQGQEPIVRFRTVSAAKTPATIHELCLMYREANNQGHSHPLIVSAALVFDFLCVHPFRDGNGRVSRLLTLLTTYHYGLSVGRYISLERLVEESKEDYYENLARSSQGWHEGKHDLLPWINYYLAILRRAGVDFRERAGQTRAPRGAKAQLILNAIGQLGLEFKLTELEALCPGAGRDWIRQLLKELKAAGKVECLGRGPGAIWRKKG